MKWTRQQKKIIDVRDKDVLVSAAAGSGKTAVLVERIIRRISGEELLNIDELLVVTFTNAAAAQMRERIGEALEKKLKEELTNRSKDDPYSLHLQKQIALLPASHITTIHSFCLMVIRNYFNMIDLDPSFRMADEAEIRLLKADVIGEVLEGKYKEGSEEFLNFIESYSSSKSDEPIEEIVLKLYDFAMSNPWPKEWIKDKLKHFELEDMDDFNNQEWMLELKNYVESMMSNLLIKVDEADRLINAGYTPESYIEIFERIRNILEQLKGARYDYAYNVLGDLKLRRATVKKTEEVCPETKERLDVLRKGIMDDVKKIKEEFFFQSPEEMLEDMKNVKPLVEVLFETTLEFKESFENKKTEKNILDFNDLEHLALKILIENSNEGSENEKEIKPSLVALELRNHFKEILIDEYQDSNLVQENLLKIISKEDDGAPNRFMVGDVKQSIYKFRLAMPELFMEKHKRYTVEEVLEDGGISQYQRIDLDKNFRSRSVVLDLVNDIFREIMMEDIGGVVYDEAAELKSGAVFDEDGKDKQVELLLVSDEESELEYNKRELEAKVVAHRIKALVDRNTGTMVRDGKTKEQRRANYGDIVILLRTMAGWSEVFLDVLRHEGIPVYADTTSGFFHTSEINTLVSMMKIIDNSRQDIPLAAVLASPIVGLTPEQLAIIKIHAPKKSVLDAVNSYIEKGEDEEIKGNLKEFMMILDEFRENIKYKAIHEILQELLDRTGYRYYVSTLPGGKKREANIDLLINYAIEFDKGNNHGLFHFLRYIEKVNRYNIEFGEASVLGDGEATVRIMSIHKSKGLEFPIVFAPAFSKEFNTQDLKNKVALNLELGVGPEYIDLEKRTKVPTILKKVINNKNKIDNIGEELRVLYVAMTRAEEKLIMVGYNKGEIEDYEKDMSFSEILSSKNYTELVLPALLTSLLQGGSFPNDSGLEDGFDGELNLGAGRIIGNSKVVIKEINKEFFLEKETSRQIFLEKDKQEIEKIDLAAIYSKEVRDILQKKDDYTYSYEGLRSLPVKLAASELKKEGQSLDHEEAQVLYPVGKEHTQAFVATVPKFISEDLKEVSGAARGTIIHKVLDKVNFTLIKTREDMDKEADRLIEEGHMTRPELDKVNLDEIFAFSKSDIASRVAIAMEKGKVKKEQPFVMGIEAKDLYNDVDYDEIILVQGIIDLFFEEDGELVILDYKSDSLKPGEEDELVKRYAAQMDYYKKAIEQITKQKVKEKIIYSLTLRKEIPIG